MDINLAKYSIEKIDYRKVKPFQGNLKETLTSAQEKKILKSLKEKGKFVPEYVWKDKKNNIWSLDGHRRLAVYTKNQVTFSGSYKIPFLVIEAKDEKDAKEKLLILNSHYGKITRKGLMDFTTGMDIKWMNNTLGLSGFDNFNFMEQARNMEKRMNQDMITPKEQQEQPPQQQSTSTPQTKQEEPSDQNTTTITDNSNEDDGDSGDDYVSYTEILTSDNKMKLVDTISRVKTSYGLDTNADALMYIIEKFLEQN